MRVKITFEPVPEIISLPVHYNHIVQGFIYHNLNRAHDRSNQWVPGMIVSTVIRPTNTFVNKQRTSRKECARVTG